jgi:hypothetical protein
MLHTKKTQEQYISPHSEQFYRYLGLVALAVERKTDETYLEQQIVTELAESLDAEMGTHDNPIPLIVGTSDIYSENGDSLVTSLDAWREQWAQTASTEDTYTWFAGITAAEADEMRDVIQFAKTASNGDVMVVVSPFPEEAYADHRTSRTVSARGFRPDIRRSFIRAYEKEQSGIKEHIQSVDTSNLDAWNEVLSQFGISPSRTTHDLLERRSTFRGCDAKVLVAGLASTYDAFLYRKTGINYTYGRPKISTIEANHFVRKYPEIINDTITDLKALHSYESATAELQAEKILYKSKALLEDLYNEYLQNGTMPNLKTSVSDARMSAGIVAQSEGKTFYGCSGESGNETVVGSGFTRANALNSLSISLVSHKKAHNGLEIHACVTCPLCGVTVDAVYDPKAKTYSCVKKSCKGYNENMVDRANNRTNRSAQKTKDFGDLLVEFIFGDEEKKQKNKSKR